MIVRVLPRAAAARLTRRPPSGRRVAMISISSPSAERAAPIRPGGDVRVVLPLAFEDVVEGPGAMSREDAARVAAMARRQAGRVDELVVHCDAGVSRSAAVAAALAERPELGVSEIIHAAPPRPNPAVLRAVRAALKTEFGCEAPARGR